MFFCHFLLVKEKANYLTRVFRNLRNSNLKPPAHLGTSQIVNIICKLRFFKKKLSTYLE
jgi:hypothetical protein